MTQYYGQLDPLYDAVRLRFPEIEVVRSNVAKADGSPDPHMRVRYRSSHPRRIVWDDGLGVYRWNSGPDAGAQLGRDVNRAADQIAWTLGVTRDHWRPGRKVGRTLYIHRDGAETGELVGMVDTPELALAICVAMNARNNQTEVTDER